MIIVWKWREWILNNLKNSLQTVRLLRLRFLNCSVLAVSFLVFYVAHNKYSVLFVGWLNYWMNEELTPDCDATFLCSFHGWISLLYPVSIQSLSSWSSLLCFQSNIQKPPRELVRSKGSRPGISDSRGTSI